MSRFHTKKSSTCPSPSLYLFLNDYKHALFLEFRARTSGLIRWERKMTRPRRKCDPHTRKNVRTKVFLFKVNQEALSGLPGCRNLWSWRSCNWKTPSYLLGYSVTHAKQAAGGRTLVLQNKGWKDLSHFWDDTFKWRTNTTRMKRKYQLGPLKNPLIHFFFSKFLYFLKFFPLCFLNLSHFQ